MFEINNLPMCSLIRALCALPKITHTNMGGFHVASQKFLLFLYIYSAASPIINELFCEAFENARQTKKFAWKKELLSSSRTYKYAIFVTPSAHRQWLDCQPAFWWRVDFTASILVFKPLLHSGGGFVFLYFVENCKPSNLISSFFSFTTTKCLTRFASSLPALLGKSDTRWSSKLPKVMFLARTSRLFWSCWIFRQCWKFSMASCLNCRTVPWTSWRVKLRFEYP